MDVVSGVVIGAGVVGLAVARQLCQADTDPQATWLVLEQFDAIGTQTSSRNSEVIHAGIYYPQHSRKAQWCVQGKAMLYDYLQARGLPHRACGKLIVATQPEHEAVLQRIVSKAEANGVLDLQWLDGDQVKAMEPALNARCALLSPSTGIVDSHAYMLSLQGDFENAGGVVALHSRVLRVTGQAGDFVLHMADGTTLGTRVLVNASGLRAPELASAMSMFPPEHVPPMHFAKGNYFTLTGKAPFSRLIYPVPEAAGLGVHLTLDMGGQAKFGPDVEWVQKPDDLAVNPQRLHDFEQAIRQYWPGLPDGALAPGYAGMRPKINAEGETAADFSLQGPADHGVEGLVQLFGIESPGLTSSLAIAQAVEQALKA